MIEDDSQLQVCTLLNTYIQKLRLLQKHQKLMNKPNNQEFIFPQCNDYVNSQGKLASQFTLINSPQRKQRKRSLPVFISQSREQIEYLMTKEKLAMPNVGRYNPRYECIHARNPQFDFAKSRHQRTISLNQQPLTISPTNAPLIAIRTIDAQTSPTAALNTSIDTTHQRKTSLKRQQSQMLPAITTSKRKEEIELGRQLSHIKIKRKLL